MEPDWSEISPCRGFDGWTDRLIGPGATPAELLVQLVPSLGAMVVAPVYAVTLSNQWTALQLAVIGLLALDIVGGVLTNATSSAKRWYHRPGQGWRQHLGFVFLHLLHLWLVALLLRGGDWGFWLATSGYLLGASLLILWSPLYLQRPIAFGLYGLSLIGDRYFLSPTPGLEWFLPLFFLKLLVSHLLREMPYPPGRFQEFQDEG